MRGKGGAIEVGVGVWETRRLSGEPRIVQLGCGRKRGARVSCGKAKRQPQMAVKGGRGASNGAMCGKHRRRASGWHISTSGNSCKCPKSLPVDNKLRKVPLMIRFLACVFAYLAFTVIGLVTVNCRYGQRIAAAAEERAYRAKLQEHEKFLNAAILRSASLSMKTNVFNLTKVANEAESPETASRPNR